MINKKMLLSAAVLLIMSSSLLSGCGETIMAAEKASTEPSLTQSSETAETAESNESTFCFDDFNYITIGDTTVSLPFSVEELGEGYYIDNYVDENNVRYDNEYALYYNSDQILLVRQDEEKRIVSFMTLDMTKSSINIMSIDRNSTPDDIITLLGDPDLYSEHERSIVYTYYDLNGSIKTHFEDNRLSDIHVSSKNY